MGCLVWLAAARLTAETGLASTSFGFLGEVVDPVEGAAGLIGVWTLLFEPEFAVLG